MDLVDRNTAYYSGSIGDTARKTLVVYFAVLRIPDREPELIETDYVFTDDYKKLERKLRYKLTKESSEAEYLEILIRPID